MGLAFDSAGNLYVANQGGHIQKFTPDGVGSLFANTGALNMFIAIQVPEPSTRAGLQLGAAALLIARRRK